jgi:tetratricopeptide (TPR) repeat protein
MRQLAIINPAIKDISGCHSGESRKPEICWMPDQVRHDGVGILSCRFNDIKCWIILVMLAGIFMLGFGCSLKKAPPASPPESTSAPQVKQEGIKPVSPSKPSAQPIKPAPPPEAKPEPRKLAAVNLVEQGKNYLDNGNPDQALGVFERALSVDPSNGKAYYYMAEAWIMKQNKRQASEFNRLAAMYLAGDRQWEDKAAGQQLRIQAMP